jgi:putative hydrolase of HD superfamily
VGRQELEATTRYLYEVGHLKRSRRQGWWQAGIDDPESIAEHSFRVAVIGYVLAAMEGADPQATAATCLFHDVIESRLGDIPNVTKHYTSPEPPEAVSRDQLAGLPTEVANKIQSLVRDYAGHGSREALLASDADKLECIMQAREYQSQGYQNVEPWITSNLAKLRSESARALAVVCQELPPDQWWKTFAQANANNPATAETDSLTQGNTARAGGASPDE